MQTYKILFTTCLAIAYLSLFAQNKGELNKERNSSISVAFFSYLTQEQDINRFYEKRPDADFTSKHSISYQGKFEYSRLIGNGFEASLGIIAGVYPIEFRTSFESDFSQTGREFNSFFITRNNAIYAGFTINVGYIQNLGSSQFLSIRAGANYVLFIPQYYNYTARIHTGTQILTVFEAHANINPSGKAFLAPEIALRYHRKIGQRFIPYVGFNGVYSANKPIVGNQFTIYGINENLQGTFTKQFVHFGVELGLKMTL
ncbi:MAG: hypothetical protein ACE5D7_07985 [Fidelibacterota bacterium]